jgi:hypothetical protein
MPAPGVSAFGDGSHESGATGLTINGGNFGAFPGSAWIFANSDGSGAADELVVGDWGDLVLTGVEIPSSLNNVAGTKYLRVQREDLAWSNSFSFTLSIAAAPETPAAAQTAAGSGKRGKRRRMFVQIDEQDFEVSSLEEAQRILEKAKRLAVESAEETVAERTEKRVKRGKSVKIDLPTITTKAPELKSLVSTYRDDIEAIYRRMALDAEIGQLLRLKWQRELDDDDEEALFVLLH